MLAMGEERFELNEEEKKELLRIARVTVETLAEGLLVPEFKADDPLLNQNRGAFVTLRRKDGRLRGCIGLIEAVRPLIETVRDMAVSASSRDPRFPPVTPGELDELEIEISVLTPLELVEDISSIVVGQHGLTIRKGSLSGLLLPQVATEYGWDKETFLQETCHKAGLPADAWKEGAEIMTFSAQVFSE